MSSNTKQAVAETVKEVGRIAFFAALSAVVSYGATKTAGLDPNSVYAVVLTVVLRALDKYVHENQNINAGGVAPF